MKARAGRVQLKGNANALSMMEVACYCRFAAFGTLTSQLPCVTLYIITAQGRSPPTSPATKLHYRHAFSGTRFGKQGSNFSRYEAAGTSGGVGAAWLVFLAS